MADATAAWQEFFGHWPDEMSRQGILVTSFGEQIPFANFLCKPSLLLLERPAPDSIGARTVVLSYQQVEALKITQVVKTRTFVAAGFEGPAPKEPAAARRAGER